MGLSFMYHFIADPSLSKWVRVSTSTSVRPKAPPKFINECVEIGPDQTKDHTSSNLGAFLCITLFYRPVVRSCQYKKVIFQVDFN